MDETQALALIEQCREFYGDMLAFERVRLRPSRFVGRAPWTCNNVIRWKAGTSMTLPDLIHELAHVWQHQHGQTQILSGILEQLRYLRGHDPYDYGGPRGVRLLVTGHGRLTDLSKESQAQIIEECWKEGHGYSQDRLGYLFTAQYAADLTALVNGAGIGRPPQSRPLAARPDLLPRPHRLDAVVAWLINRAIALMEARTSRGAKQNAK